MQVTEEMVLVFTTETGSTYEINKGKIRRLNPRYEKRGDGNWHRLASLPWVWFDTPVTLAMESLSEYGEDDYGYAGVSDVTIRVTSHVVGIEVQEAPCTTS